MTARRPTGPEITRIRAGLAHAFDRPGFDDLLLGLDRGTLDDFAGPADSFPVAVRKAVAEAGRRGWLAELLAAAHDGVPDDPELAGLSTLLEVGRPPAAGSSGEAAYQILDLTFLDLTDLVDCFNTGRVRAGARRVLGVATELRDQKFVAYLCRRLRQELGERHPTEIDPDGTTLSPDVWSASVALERIAGHHDNLAHRNIIFTVWCDTADAALVHTLWTDVCARLTGIRRYLTLVLVTPTDAELPPDIVALPRPTLQDRDLQLWALRVVEELDWPPELAPFWSARLIQRATIAGGLTIEMVYTLLERDIGRLKDAAEQQKLRNELRTAWEAAR